MKKKLWMILLGTLLLTVSVIPASIASAASNDDVRQVPQRPRLDGLALIVPVRAPLNADITMTVLQRSDLRPVEGAGIWVLTSDEAEALSTEIQAMQSANSTDKPQIDWETVLTAHGTLLGRTDNNGKFTTSFTEEGRYVLVATRSGYMPGRSRIAVKEMPVKLTMRNAARAQVDEEIRINVSDQFTGNPIESAGIWAFTREQADTLKTQMDALRESSGGQVAPADAEALVRSYGTYIGDTDNTGTLGYAFSEAGGYMLAAVKSGCIPGRSVVRVFSETDGALASGRVNRFDNSANITASRAEIY